MLVSVLLFLLLLSLKVLLQKVIYAEDLQQYDLHLVTAFFLTDVVLVPSCPQVPVQLDRLRQRTRDAGRRCQLVQGVTWCLLTSAGGRREPSARELRLCRGHWLRQPVSHSQRHVHQWVRGQACAVFRNLFMCSATGIVDAALDSPACLIELLNDT